MTRTAPPGPRARARARARRRVGDRLDLLEAAAGASARARPPGSARALRRRGRDERVADARESAASIPSTSLSREDRGDDDVVAPSAAASSSQLDAVRRCARRPRSRPSPRRSSRPGSATSTCAVDRPAEERLGRGARATSPGCATRPASRARASASHSGSPSTTVAPGATTASFSRGDRLARLAEHVGVLERRRSSARRPARRGRSSRRAARRGRPRRPRRRRRASANSASAAAVSTSNCVAPEPLGRGPHARDRALEVGGLARRPDPLAPAARRAARCTRRRAAPRARSSAADRPRRRRLAVRADDVDRRVGALRVAERGEQRAHPVEAELLRPRRERLATPGSVAEGIELAAVALELLALGLDDLGAARSRRSARSRASSRRARSRSRRRSRSASTLPFAFAPLGLHDRVEDPLLVALERRRARRCAGRSRPPPARARARRRRACARRPRARARRSAASRAPGRFDQISSVTCGITGCSSFSSRSSAASAVARASASPS